jgi:hypothetical protein
MKASTPWHSIKAYSGNRRTDKKCSAQLREPTHHVRAISTRSAILRLPGWTHGKHAENLVTNFLLQPFPAIRSPSSEDPRPVRRDSSAVPADYRLETQDNQRLFPPRQNTSCRNLRAICRTDLSLVCDVDVCTQQVVAAKQSVRAIDYNENKWEFFRNGADRR